MVSSDWPGSSLSQSQQEFMTLWLADLTHGGGLCVPSAASLRSMLDDFDVLPLSSLRTHSVRRRDVQTQTHVEKLVSFDALQRSEVTPHTALCLRETPEENSVCLCVCVCRQFRLYLRTNDQLFTEDFRAVIVEEDGRERSYAVNRHNYFTGHVIGNNNQPETFTDKLIKILYSCCFCCRGGKLTCSGSYRRPRVLRSHPDWRGRVQRRGEIKTKGKHTEHYY